MSKQDDNNVQDSMLNMLNRLFNGERVICSTCNIGVLQPLGGTNENTRCFQCDKCGELLNID